jgi:beta-N-acetylhexosaminidase
MIDHRLLPLFCVGFDGTSLPDHVRTWLADGLGGVILFRRNCQELEQVLRLTADIRAAASGPVLIGVDQEGGRVVRLPPPFLAPPAAGRIGARGDPALAQRLARAVGRELRAAGINWNLAPVLDIHTNPDNPVIGDRAYGTDPDTVARFGLAVIAGLTEAGVLATAKHFPGHGDTRLDSHVALPESLQSPERWRAVEFAPFSAAIRAGVPTVLTAHLCARELDPTTPASLSRTVTTDILRGELGFDGVVVSDDLEMGGITTYCDVGEAAVRFLEAGGDLLLVCKEVTRQVEAMGAVGAALKSGRLPPRMLEVTLERVSRLYSHIPGGVSPAATIEEARSVIGSVEHRAICGESSGG